MFIDLLHTQIYLGGDIIIREGDVGMEMYFLVKGKAAVVIKSGAQVAVYEDGAYFGELALIKEAPRSAHVFANSKTIFIFEIYRRKTCSVYLLK